MITGFEDQTHELTEYELSLIPMFVRRLEKKIGVENAVTSTHVVRMFKEHGLKMSAPRFRKIINHIRINGLVPMLIASSKGYYVAKDKAEVKEYLDSLKQRINSITRVYDALEYDYEKA